MTTAADSAIQQITVNDMPKRGGKRDRDRVPSLKILWTAHHFDTSYPKVIRKTTQPSLKEEVNFFLISGCRKRRIF